VIRQLAAYGFFKAGGVLIGTHAFVAYGNLLGVRWIAGDRTLDVDFAHAGKNVSIALPTDVELSVHDALTSLEMGLLPLVELHGKLGAQYRNPKDPELRLDFLTPRVRRGAGPVVVPSLDLALEPLPFMELILEGVEQAAVIGTSGASLVNVPAPERYAVHKLIVYGERRGAAQVKAVKDLEQGAALARWFLEHDRSDVFRKVWRDALARGPGWRRRATVGRTALLRRHPDLDDRRLW
jgi:hypothetical protein